MSEGKIMNYDCPLCGKQMAILTDSIGYSYQCNNPECVICETMDYFRPDTIDALSIKIAGLELDRTRLAEKDAEIEAMKCCSNCFKPEVADCFARPLNEMPYGCDEWEDWPKDSTRKRNAPKPKER